ncbi:alpha/beta hydrolase [Maricaulis maris]|uniref:Acetyl esterase n=1 Tax=Maricaulis maris TaxID=74318 RepID=A0A495CW58_9PROT|nr:alpha/beta hydrolase [Maricaulis maris]RKQ89504.1 acetyl esterase [Maricaulis maris]
MDAPAWPEALTKFGLQDPLEPARAAPRMREALRNAAPHMDVRAPDLAEVRDLTVPGGTGEIAARLYRPNGADAPGPCTFFTHGGGYVIGDLETHDSLCRRLAAKSGMRVLAIDYRLAPEHPWPAGVEDALAAFDWLVGPGAAEVGALPDRIAVAGDSAGGGLAAILAQTRRMQICFQLLIYPLLQLVERRKPKPKWLEGHLLSSFTLDQVVRAYLTDPAQAVELSVSPLLNPDLAGLPPAHIIAAELDPLLDEGQAYRDLLLAAGNTVSYALGKALPHGYFNLTAVLPGAKAIVDETALILGDGLRR